VERRSANRSLLRWGFVLISLGALTGLTGALLGPHGRRYIAAVAGVLCGMFLVLLGLAWRHLNLSVTVGRILEGLARAATYGVWVLALLPGLRRPGPGAGGPVPWQQLASTILTTAVWVAGLAALAMIVMAIRPRPRPPGTA
jgi:hypothetical protein